MMSYTKILKEKQRSPAITCHLTFLPYLRKGIFTNVYLDYLDKKKKKKSEYRCQHYRELMLFWSKVQDCLFKLADGKIHREKKNGNKNKLGPNVFWVTNRSTFDLVLP